MPVRMRRSGGYIRLSEGITTQAQLDVSWRKQIHSRRTPIACQKSQRDIGVAPTCPGVRVPDGPGQGGAGPEGGHDFVDHANLHRLLDTTGDALVLRGQLCFDLGWRSSATSASFR